MRCIAKKNRNFNEAQIKPSLEREKIQIILLNIWFEVNQKF